MALDEPKDDDLSVEAGGLTYLIEKELQERLGDVEVDYMDQGWRSGFTVSSENPIQAGPSTCGGSCSC